MRDSPRVWFHTFGCKANQYDTERMRQELEARGARTVDLSGDANVAVINTCTVTNQADASARHLIRRLRREHPSIKIVVAGCSTAVRESDYRALAEVDGVVPGQDPGLVADQLVELRIPPRPTGRVPLERNARGTRGWLKIQSGCDRKCSFCATRLARGASGSRPPGEILREARILARSHPELVITGIHIGHYGHDLTDGTTLAELCARLLEAVPVRLRLSSIEATEIDDALLDLIVTSGGQLAPHLHVPMQSGSDHVLGLMRRWHTREAYRARVLEIAEAVSTPFGLGADIIVGFPGEGPVHFEETRALVEELPYTYLHVFPFSVRDGTVAASLPDRVPGDVAADRSRVLRRLAEQKGAAYRDRRVGEVADIVAEGHGDRRVGMTGDYLRVDLPRSVGAGTRFKALLGAREGRLVAETPALEAVSEGGHPRVS